VLAVPSMRRVVAAILAWEPGLRPRRSELQEGPMAPAFRAARGVVGRPSVTTKEVVGEPFPDGNDADKFLGTRG
jgi:hypothetical protein